MVEKVKKLCENSMASDCWLLSDGNVLKEYKRSGFVDECHKNDVEAHWWKEIRALLELKKCIAWCKNHFPELLNVDFENRTIKMSYCGEAITKANLPDNWESQCYEMKGMIHQIGIWHNDIFVKNILVLNNNLYLIDFGAWDANPRGNNSIIEAIKKEVLCVR